MRNLLFIVLTLTLYTHPMRAQDTCALRISLLTCTPGSELYSIFGHSALRVIDQSTGTDIVYNYGTFDFGDPNFYSKFVRGKLLYALDREAFPNFIYGYRLENRGIVEQVVNLSCEKKRDIQRFVENNLREENRYYKYDFLYDNCTTRLRDILQPYTTNIKPIEMAKGMTFRNGIHSYLNKGQMHWSKLGIDLLLGARIDKKMTNDQAMFLPEFLEAGMDGAGTPNGNIVLEKNTVVTRNEEETSASGWLTPMVLFSMFSLVIIALSFVKRPAIQKGLRVFDRVLFFILGLLGCLFLFMWFGTDHKQTAENYNLFWAWPIHLAVVFILYSGRWWVKRYLSVYMLVMGLLLVLWRWLPQELNPALVPIVSLLIFRSWSIINSNVNNQKSA
ncbi:MAG: DUF4105 domain-containing protein [Sphingobacteriales bacterium]|nr:MAG: DUF4105 domain-containing protein [Sphingobacteriales bacterium]